MGSPKALLEFRGETFLDRLIHCLAGRCDPVMVVLGHEPEIVRAGTRSPGTTKFVLNAHYQLGQFSSLQCGLRAVPPHAEGVVFTPVDHPNIEASTVAQLIDSRATVAIPRYLGRHGHPVFCKRGLIEEFLELAPGDQAPTVLRRHASETRYIDVSDAGILDDIDDPEAYQRLLATK